MTGFLAGTSLVAGPPKQDPLPQVQAVIEQFSAVLQDDANRLKESYSKRVQQRLEKRRPWAETLKLYREAMTKELGDYRLDDFRYSYHKRDLTNGIVKFSVNGKTGTGCPVFLYNHSSHCLSSSVSVSSECV